MHFGNGLVVRVPQSMSIQQIEKFLIKKQNWILEKLEFLHKNTPEKVIRDFSQGENLIYLGNEYPILHVPIETKRLKIKFFDNKFEIHHPKDFDFDENAGSVKAKIIEWYKVASNEVIKNRVSIYESKMNVEPLEIKIRSYRSRWGACRENGKITFNWKLIQTPVQIIDYVIVHELSHLVHLNHSKLYWKLVQKYSPNYKIHRDWLKRNILHLRFD